MAYKIVYKAYAEKDIWEIADYLSDHSIQVAESFLHEIKNRVEGLTDMPFMYPNVSHHKEYRKVSVGNYVVIYLVDDRTKQILIIRVVHGRRDREHCENLLFPLCSRSLCEKIKLLWKDHVLHLEIMPR